MQSDVVIKTLEGLRVKENTSMVFANGMVYAGNIPAYFLEVDAL